VRRSGDPEDRDEVSRNPGISLPSSGLAARSPEDFFCIDPRHHEIWLVYAASAAHARAMNLLSIQSHVPYRHVGNSAAVLALQRLGVEVWPVHTIELSNHPGYGSATGRVTEAAVVRELIAGLAARGALARCDGIISGYLGAAAIGQEIVATVARVKS